MTNIKQKGVMLDTINMSERKKKRKRLKTMNARERRKRGIFKISKDNQRSVIHISYGREGWCYKR